MEKGGLLAWSTAGSRVVVLHDVVIHCHMIDPSLHVSAAFVWILFDDWGLKGYLLLLLTGTLQMQNSLLLLSFPLSS